MVLRKSPEQGPGPYFNQHRMGFGPLDATTPVRPMFRAAHFGLALQPGLAPHKGTTSSLVTMRLTIEGN